MSRFEDPLIASVTPQMQRLRQIVDPYEYRARLTMPKLIINATGRSLTNLRVTRDPSSATGWKVELAPYPGRKDLATW